MDQTFLLRTLYRVVRCIKIRHQNARKILEHRLDRAAFPGWGIKICDLFHTGENPDVAISFLDADAGLVNMQQAAAAQPFQEFVVGAFVVCAAAALNLLVMLRRCRVRTIYSYR